MSTPLSTARHRGVFLPRSRAEKGNYMKIVSIRQFAEEVRNRLSEKLAGYELELREFPQNNGTRYSLVAHKPGTNAAPAFNLNPTYKDFVKRTEDGECDVLDAVVDGICETVLSKYSGKMVGSLSNCLTEILDHWRERVYVKLVGKAGNESYLSDKVYVDFLDMAKVYYLRMCVGDDPIGSVDVTKEMFSRFGVSLAEFDEIAVKNTEATPFEVLPILEFLERDTIQCIQQSDRSDEEKEEAIRSAEAFFEVARLEREIPMLVVSAEDYAFGAVGMILTNVLGEVREKLDGADFYILPSSIDEFIAVPAVPAIPDISLDTLREMVCLVNGDDTVMSPEQVLTNSVYFSDGTKIVVASDEAA